MELAANKVKNTRDSWAAGVKLWIYKKDLLFDIDNNKKTTSDSIVRDLLDRTTATKVVQCTTCTEGL